MNEEQLGEKRARIDLPGPSQLLEPDEKRLKIEETSEYSLSQFSKLLAANDNSDDIFHSGKFSDDSQLAPLHDSIAFAQLEEALPHEDDTYQDAQYSTDESTDNNIYSPKEKFKKEKYPEISIDSLPSDQLRALAGLDPIVPNVPLPRKNPGTANRGRKKKPLVIIEEDPDPDGKWKKAATEKLLEVYQEYGMRRVVDQKLHSGVKECLEKGANPAVTLSSADGSSFFTILTVAAEKGIILLVQYLVSTFYNEFSEFDKKHALQAALRAREQEIAELFINEGAPIDKETLMLVLDTRMSDESERKIFPLKAVLDRIDNHTLSPDEFFQPEFINRAIYADNVAALELLFERNREQMLELLEVPSPVKQTTIRACRGKVQDFGEGVPPLAFAAVMERGECLDVFLRNGANPNFIWDEMGGTLLHIVGFKNNCELIELLIQHHADPRIPNSRGVTVLSRTKGRKARKFIRDACNKFDRLEKGYSYEGTLLPSVSAALTGSASHSMMQPSITPHELTLPPVYSPMHHPSMQSHQSSQMHHIQSMHQSIMQSHQNQSIHHTMHSMHHPHSNHPPSPLHLGNHPLNPLSSFTNQSSGRQSGSPIHQQLLHQNQGIPSPMAHQSLLQTGQLSMTHQSLHQGFPHQENDR